LDNPTISDKEYDILYSELLHLEDKIGYVYPNSITQRVGGQVLDGFEKVIHKNKLWSLDKAQTKEGLLEWHNRNIEFINTYNRNHPKSELPPLEYVITKKFDGLTVKCDYNNGNFTKGSTRGTGEIGEDITEQAKTIINLPKQICFNRSISFHGEGLMTKKAFKEYNKTAKNPLKNLRNGVAGALRNLNTTETAKRKCMIQFYNINDCDFNNFESYSQRLNFMRAYGLPVCDYVMVETFEEMINMIHNIESHRDSLQYDIDGVVIAINNMETRELMGYTGKFPKHSIAYKFEAEEVTTTLIDVEFNTGRTGKITPTGILEPVDLMGVTVKRATLNNMDDIKRKNVKVGGRVFIRRSNDVIPEIMGNADDNGVEINVPETCPSCGSKLIQDGVHWFCKNTASCKPQLIKSISNYASRDCMNIVGLSDKTVEKLQEEGYIESIADLYRLDRHAGEIISMDGFGVQSFNNMILAIEKSKYCKLENFILGLGIEGVGKGTSKDIVKHIEGTSLEKLQQIRNMSVNEFINVKDIGLKTAESLFNWFHNSTNIELLDELLRYIIFVEEEKKTVSTDGVFKGMKIYCTGTFANYKKDELKKLVEDNGGEFASGYAKSLGYLVIGSLKGSSKEAKAIKDDVKILTEDMFLEMIGGK
jgi:DNA ligase (NAD+)